MSGDNLTEDEIKELARLRKKYENVLELLSEERGKADCPLEYADVESLKEARNLVHMSQKDMADVIHITQPAYSIKENNPKTISWDDLEGIIEALDNADVDELISSAAVSMVLGQVKVNNRYYRSTLEKKVKDEAIEGLSLLSKESLLTVQSVIISMIKSELLSTMWIIDDYEQELSDLEEEMTAEGIPSDDQRKRRDLFNSVIKESRERNKELESYCDRVSYPQDIRLYLNEEGKVEEIADGFSTLSKMYET